MMTSRIPWNKGKKMDLSTRLKLSESHKGLHPWNYGKSVVIPPEQRAKMIAGVTKSWEKRRKYFLKNCITCGGFFKARPWAIKKGWDKYCSWGCRKRPEMSLMQLGRLNPNWKGGVSDIRMKIRLLSKYDSWRISVFIRDKKTCVRCGSRIKIQAHHLKPFSQILDENNISTYEQAVLCEELWDVDNGKTLCKECHKEVTYS